MAKMCRLPLLAAIVFMLQMTGGASCDDDSAITEAIDLESRLRSFAEDFDRTAVATRTRLLEALRNELLSTQATFSGQIIGFSEINLQTAVELADWRRRPPLGWEFRGRSVPPPGCDGASREQCAEISRRRIKTLLPEGDGIHMVIVQDGNLLVYALTQSQEILDRLRSGTRVRIVVWPQGLADGTVVAVLESVELDQAKLVCENGHSFPVDSGFSFCPRCGSALKHAN